VPGPGPGLVPHISTRDCFLFRLINRAFRTRNIDNVFKFRYFFLDLQQQLTHLYQSQKKSLPLQTVYRGQIISANEIQKLKKKQRRYLFREYIYVNYH
jgi:hypothetical protein